MGVKRTQYYTNPVWRRLQRWVRERHEAGERDLTEQSLVQEIVSNAVFRKYPEVN